MLDEDPTFTNQAHKYDDYTDIGDNKLVDFVKPLFPHINTKEDEGEYKEQFPEMVKLTKKNVDYAEMFKFD